MIKLAAVASCILLAAPALAQESLLCVIDMSTGFKWMENQWRQMTFNVDASKYTVRPAENQSAGPVGIDYEVYKLGDQNRELSCVRYKLVTGELAPQMLCGTVMWSMVVNFSTMRIQEHYGFGFVDALDRPSDTPMIAIGKCGKV